MNLPHGVMESADVTAVTQLILLERESRDLARWDRMRACFHRDSLIRVSWFTGNGEDFVAGSIDMAKRGMPAKHRLAPVLVRIAGDRAVATLIDIATSIDRVEAQLSSHARFYYRAERREQGWRLSGFDGVYLRDELVPAIPGDRLPVRAAEVAAFRRSYRMLSYVLSRHGYTVNAQLPGDDRPELVRALEDELFGWAGITP